MISIMAKIKKTSLKLHFIAIGGKVMHNLALAMSDKWHKVTGSDDEIYEPSLSRLDAAGILPAKMGWYTDNITEDLDYVILGMHAKADNPELLRAQELSLRIMSFPEFVYEQSKDKQRIVIAGSHGKTTTSAMIAHALESCDKDFDYVVGAQLPGFDRMVKLTDAPIIIIEGDEYLSSAIDRRPKMLLYKATTAVITGIAWDHINVFPTYEGYVDQFRQFLKEMSAEGKVFYYGQDSGLKKLINEKNTKSRCIPYNEVELNEDRSISLGTANYNMQLIGSHNYQNMKAAQRICNDLGMSGKQFFRAMSAFIGADKRLEFIKNKKDRAVLIDYAHAPSKVEATVKAVKMHWPKRILIAVLELHTFSSLNKEFIPHYRHAFDPADVAVLYYSPQTLKMKNMPEISYEWLAQQIAHPKLKIFTEKDELVKYLSGVNYKNTNLLMMTSGTFDGFNLSKDGVKV